MTNPKDIEEELQFGILEDYITEAKMGSLLIDPEDATEHMARMRGHFEKLKAFIFSERERGYTEGRKDAIDVVRKYQKSFTICQCGNRIVHGDAILKALEAAKGDLVDKT